MAGGRLGVLQSTALLYGEVGEDLCPKLFQAFVKTITRGKNPSKVSMCTSSLVNTKNEKIKMCKNLKIERLLHDRAYLWIPATCGGQTIAQS